MRARWQRLMDRFSALSLRERVLVVLALLAVVYQLADLIILDRQYQQRQQLEAQLASDRERLRAAGAELQTLSMEVARDPNAELRDQIAQARIGLEELQSRLDDATRDLISPQDMARFLEELLSKEPGLSLTHLETLDAEPLLATAGEAVEPDDELAILHRQGFTIEFSGDYMATLRYLEALEALPWRFFWDSVDYQVTDYPRSIVRLRLHTLSLSEDWIGV